MTRIVRCGCGVEFAAHSSRSLYCGECSLLAKQERDRRAYRNRVADSPRRETLDDKAEAVWARIADPFYYVDREALYPLSAASMTAAYADEFGVGRGHCFRARKHGGCA